MQQAYLLINVDSGAEEEVLREIKSTGCVESAYVSYGIYDLIVKVKAENVDELKESIIYKIRKIKHVRSTLTLMLLQDKQAPSQ
jgi:DNA-binding Lrp family transcriptional regulator